jgi:hypothetical protein
MHSSISKIELS